MIDEVVNADLTTQVPMVHVVAMKYWYPENPTASPTPDHARLNAPLIALPLAGMTGVGANAVLSR